MTTRNVVFFCLIALEIAACTPKHIASTITAQIMKSGAPAFEMEPDIDLAEQSGLTMVKMIETFQHDNPKNKNYNILLARSYANYAFAFLEWNILRYQNTNPELFQKNEARAKDFYLRGKGFGMAVLNRNSVFAKALTQDVDTFNKALKKMGRADMPALFWTAFNWGSSINLNKDSPLAIAEFPKAEAMMRRVLEMDENYFYATPNIFFGFAYGSRPTMFGGNPEKSKEHFEKALAAYERKFLMAQVMYAMSYAVQNQDRALFDSLLSEVMQTPADVLPEQRLANELAKKRAQFLIDNAQSYF